MLILHTIMCLYMQDCSINSMLPVWISGLLALPADTPLAVTRMLACRLGQVVCAAHAVAPAPRVIVDALGTPQDLRLSLADGVIFRLLLDHLNDVRVGRCPAEDLFQLRVHVLLPVVRGPLKTHRLAGECHRFATNSEQTMVAAEHH